jgi:uncharacterized membrane protein YoaK (UPF0700 family)
LTAQEALAAVLALIAGYVDAYTSVLAVIGRLFRS